MTPIARMLAEVEEIGHRLVGWAIGAVCVGLVIVLGFGLFLL